MAGIVARSAARYMTDGEATPDNIVSGYVRNERITMHVTPAGADYEWLASGPSGSGVMLSSSVGETVSFVPVVQGLYVIQVTVDGTVYSIRIGVLQVAQAEPVEAVRLWPFEDSQVAAPPMGLVLYCSATQGGALVVKDAAGVVHIVTTTVAP